MLRALPMVSNPNTRKRYALRGTIRSVDVKESGWWIFKEKNCSITVCLDESQVARFNEIARQRQREQESNRVPGEYFPEIPSILDFRIAECDLLMYQNGANMAITFGCASVIDQFFTAASPLIVMDIRLLDPTQPLDHEI